jgi:hypothetical protein
MVFRGSWKRGRELWIDCGGTLQQEQNRIVAISTNFEMNLLALKQDLRRPGWFLFHSETSDETYIILMAFSVSYVAYLSIGMVVVRILFCV